MRELVLALGVGRPVYGLEPVENGKVVYRQSGPGDCQDLLP